MLLHDTLNCTVWPEIMMGIKFDEITSKQFKYNGFDEITGCARCLFWIVSRKLLMDINFTVAAKAVKLNSRSNLLPIWCFLHKNMSRAGGDPISVDHPIAVLIMFLHMCRVLTSWECAQWGTFLWYFYKTHPLMMSSYQHMVMMVSLLKHVLKWWPQ